MVLKNSVYTCENPKCEPYLFQGGILLELTADGKRYSIDPFSGNLNYYSEDGEQLQNPKDLVLCPQCGGVCLMKEASVAINVKPEEVLQTIDALDKQIGELMKKFEGK